MSDPGCQDQEGSGWHSGRAEITVLVDNETAVQNLTRMGKHAGAEVLSEKKSDNEFQVVIRVKDRKPTEGGEETAECIPDVKGDFGDRGRYRNHGKRK